MKKFLIASVSAIAFMGLAACSDTDDTQTQSIDKPIEQPMQQDEPMKAPPADTQMDQAPANEAPSE